MSKRAADPNCDENKSSHAGENVIMLCLLAYGPLSTVASLYCHEFITVL